MKHMLGAIDLNLLVALERLLALRSVTDAAKEVGLSQPAMSRTLARLRDTLGDPLLVRVGRELVLTPRAQSLVEPTRDALTAAARVFEPVAAFDPASATGELVLALGDEAQHAFADAILLAMRRHAPGVDLRVRALSEATAEDGQRGRIDLALTPDLDVLPRIGGRVDLSPFITRRLYERRFVVVSAPGLRAALDRRAYLAAGHVIVSFEAGGRGFVDDLIADLGESRRVAASVTSFHAAMRLAATTDLLATVPEEIAATGGVDVFPCPVAIPSLPMLLVWHTRLQRDTRHRFFRELVAAAVLERVDAWARSAVDRGPARGIRGQHAQLAQGAPIDPEE